MVVSTRSNRPKNKKKVECIERIKELVDNYNSLVVFDCDNVGSNQLKKVRILVREHGVLTMGKNSLFKKGLIVKGDRWPKIDRILPHLTGNVGLFFTNKSPKEVRDLLESVSEQAPVKAGMISQCDVIIPKGVTGMPPDKTSFFQALCIATMINKSSVEILSDIHLLKYGQKVGASEATLLQMLNIRPFSYKLVAKAIYDAGMVYPPRVLDISKSDILETFTSAISDIACLSLGIGYPTKASVPHVVQNGFKDIVSVCLELDIQCEKVDKFMEAAKNAAPVAVAPSGAASAGAGAAAEAKKVEKAPEPEPESEEDMGLSLFD